MNDLVRSLLARITDPVERLAALEAYDLRAGICEFDAGLSREAAEAMALAELKKRVGETR